MSAGLEGHKNPSTLEVRTRESLERIDLGMRAAASFVMTPRKEPTRSIKDDTTNSRVRTDKRRSLASLGDRKLHGLIRAEDHPSLGAAAHLAIHDFQ